MSASTAHKMKHLKDFYSPSPQLFQDATSLPQFFLTNLVDDARVVKYFPNDPQANLRIFYYQYLKLCFEIDNVDYESYIQKIYELIRTEGFEFYFQESDPLKQLKNAQYKSLLIDFFEVMNTSSLTIDQVLIQYPILDQVFINFFRSVLMIASVTFEYNSYIDKNELFDFLSSFFSVDISSYDKCLKFVESDIFVYEEDQQNIYMAYIRDDDEEEGQGSVFKDQESHYSTGVTAQNSNNTQSLMKEKPYCVSQQSSHNDLPEQTKKPIAPSSHMNGTVPKSRAKIMIKESYIEGEFADYTSYNHNISAFGKNVPIDSEKQITETVEHQTVSYQESEYIQTQEIPETQGKNEEKQLKRVLSEETHVKFGQQGSSYPKEDSQKMNHFNKGNSQPNLLSSQNNHRMIESIYDPLETGIHSESKEQIQHQEMTSHKQQKTEMTFHKNSLYQHYQEPTKDPGFGSAQGINVRSVESTIYHTTQTKQMMNSYQSNSIMEPDVNQYKPGKSTFYEQSQKSNHLQEPLFHKPSIPVPTLMNQNTLSSNGRMVTSTKPLKDLQNPGNANLASVKESFKLNVTKDFTNSLVMQSMNEPFKTNVYKIREKARQFRKNIYQEFAYQASSFVGSNEQKMTKSPSSRANYQSNSTLQRVSSSKNLAIESNIKSQSQASQNPIKSLTLNATKEETEFNNGLVKKLFDVKETIPQASEQSLRAEITSPFKVKDKIKETDSPNQIQTIKSGIVVGLGPSIVVTKQIQPQKHQFPQYKNPYPISQPTNYQVHPTQMSRPQTYQQGRIQTGPSMPYFNTFQLTEPMRMYKQQPIQMYKEQPNHVNPASFVQGYKGQIPININPNDLMYPQTFKRPNPIFVPYERKP